MVRLIKKIKKSKYKLIVLTGLFFVLFSAFLILTALYRASGEKADYIQTYIGNAVYVRTSAVSEAGLIDDTNVKLVSKQEEVKDYNTFSNYYNVIFSDINAYVPDEEAWKKLIEAKMEDRERFGLGDMKDDMRINCGLYGVKDSGTSLFFLNQGFQLTKGEHLTTDDAGKPNVLISEKIAQINKLEVGDVFTLEVDNTAISTATSPFQVKVKGIFQCDVSNNPSMWPANNSANTVIMQERTFSYGFFHLDKDTYVPGVVSMTVFLHDNDQVKPFIQRMEEEHKTLSFFSNEKWTEVAAKPVKDTQRLSGVLALIFLVGILIILLLIGMFYIRTNLKEVGIFLSMGMSKWKVAGQLLAEEMIPITIAMLLALCLSFAIINPLGDRISGNSYEQAQQTAKQLLNIIGGSGEEGTRSAAIQTLEPAKLTLHIDEEVDYTISPVVLVQYILIIMVLLPTCLLVQMLWIMKRNSVQVLLLN